MKKIKKEHSNKVSRTEGRSKGKYLKNLGDLQNLLINLANF